MVEIRGIYDDFGEPDYELSDQAYQVAQSTGIHILRDKEPVVVAVDEGQVVGALFTSLVGDSFSFDVAVSPAYQGQGIGRQLIDAGMSEYRNLKFDMPEVEMNLDVVNPMLQDVLRRRGLEIKKRVNDDRVIMGSWLLKVWRKFAQEWMYPDRSHDYEAAWDYEVDDESEATWREKVDRYTQELQEDLLPQLRLFRGIKIEFVRNLGYLAKYISGTYTYPVIVLDIGYLMEACEKHGASCEDEWRLTVLHEIGHAVQESNGVEMEEDWAEQFARIYYRSGIVLRLEALQ